MQESDAIEVDCLLRQLARDLESVQSGDRDPQQLAVDWKGRRNASPLLEAIWSSLDHYVDDSDVRSSDPQYRAMQDAELLKLISLIDRGERKKLLDITFLGKS